MRQWLKCYCAGSKIAEVGDGLGVFLVSCSFFQFMLTIKIDICISA
jgi:hypothetical protein